VEVRDEGRGGADPGQGSGLLGLRDRVEAIGGTMRLTSPPGAGTSLRVELPLVDQARSPLTHALASPPRFRPAAIRSNALQ
jgi:glucose-6-phosphate-specific signal transduction histidine kinase